MDRTAQWLSCRAAEQWTIQGPRWPFGSKKIFFVKSKCKRFVQTWRLWMKRQVCGQAAVIAGRWPTFVGRFNWFWPWKRRKCVSKVLLSSGSTEKQRNYGWTATKFRSSGLVTNSRCSLHVPRQGQIMHRGVVNSPGCSAIWQNHATALSDSQGLASFCCFVADHCYSTHSLMRQTRKWHMPIVADILQIYASLTAIVFASWWPTLNVFISETIRHINMQIGYNTVHRVCNEVAE